MKRLHIGDVILIGWLAFLALVFAGSRAAATGDEAVRSMRALESIAHSLEKCPR